MSSLAALAERPTVGLAELVDHAGLLTRVDRKYLLSRADAEVLVDLLPDQARVLDIDGVRVFGYRSTYYDTDAWTSYRGAAQKRRRRFKVRRRVYLDSGQHWLEVKTRQGRFTVKERVAVDPGEGRWGGLYAPHAQFVADRLAAAQVPPVDPAALHPAVETSYRRATVLLPGDAARLTLDTALTWTNARTGGALGAPDLVIVETKTAGAPCGADRLLWSLGTRPAKVSKYATGVAVFHPELPQTKWRRTLRRLPTIVPLSSSR
jgi:hypothetical protein